MEIIKKYRADDGTEFEKSTACLAYECECRTIDKIIEPMGLVCCGPAFSNGEGYLQHNPKLVAAIRKVLLAQAAKTSHPSHAQVFNECADGSRDASYAERIIFDGGMKYFARAFSRISNTDHLGREWDQKYFVLHPNKNAKRLNR